MMQKHIQNLRELIIEISLIL